MGETQLRQDTYIGSKGKPEGNVAAYVDTSMLFFIPTTLAKPQSDSRQQWDWGSLDLPGTWLSMMKGAILEDLKRIAGLFEDYIPTLAQRMN